LRVCFAFAISFTAQTFLGEKKEDVFVYDPVSYYTRLGFTVREDLQFSHWVIMPFENHHSLVILETLPEQDVRYWLGLFFFLFLF
jgi:hypothetical protein